MLRMRAFAIRAAIVAAAGAAVGVSAQRRDAFSASREHPAIAYSAREGTNAVRKLDDALAAGREHLVFEDPQRGYVRSVLAALGVNIESQVLVFSETSKQSRHISPAHPRAIYFNDSVAVGWVPGTDILELAAQDPEQGMVFYTLEQKPASAPRFTREIGCLLCHLTWDTRAVPGAMTLSTFPMSDDPNAYADGVVVDHRTPIAERWGGWYVTGRLVPPQHMGNAPVIRPAHSIGASRNAAPPKLASIAGSAVAEPSVYLSPQSDVTALLVLNHQTQAMNLLTWLGWQTRVALAEEPDPAPQRSPAFERVDDAVRELVDYFLFVDEAPLPSPVAGTSGFAARFAAAAPRDALGRSLRDLDLSTRLLRYRCSYMIYSAAFDALPAPARDRVYARLWRVLSGEEHDRRYETLSAADRRAIVDILRSTKRGLPDYFR